MRLCLIQNKNIPVAVVHVNTLSGILSSSEYAVNVHLVSEIIGCSKYDLILTELRTNCGLHVNVCLQYDLNQVNIRNVPRM